MEKKGEKKEERQKIIITFGFPLTKVNLSGKKRFLILEKKNLTENKYIRINSILFCNP